MSTTVQTFKGARASGPGDPLGNLVYGQHAKGGPLQFHRAIPGAANLFDNPNSAGLGGFWQRDHNSGYVAGEYTETKSASGTLALASAGLLFTTDANNNDRILTQFLKSWTPTARGNRAWLYARVQGNTVATTQAIRMGFATTTTDPIGSAPTNEACIYKATGAGTVIGTATTIGSVGTLLTMANATEYDLGLIITPTSTTSAQVQYFAKAVTAAWSVTGTHTATFTAGAQRPYFMTQTTTTAARTMTISRFAFGMED